jgi:hypothetical protein
MSPSRIRLHRRYRSIVRLAGTAVGMHVCAPRLHAVGGPFRAERLLFEVVLAAARRVDRSVRRTKKGPANGAFSGWSAWNSSFLSRWSLSPASSGACSFRIGEAGEMALLSTPCGWLRLPVPPSSVRSSHPSGPPLRYDLPVNIPLRTPTTGRSHTRCRFSM